MTEKPRRYAVAGFFAGVVTVVVIVLIWSAWSRSRDVARMDLSRVAPAAPELPAPRPPDAPLIPDAPVPTPK